MKVGNLVKRKSPWKNIQYNPQREDNGIGIVLSIQLAGATSHRPVHSSATVFYPSLSKKCDIAVSQLEVISEGG